MQLIFDRRVTRRTPGRFRTRVLTEGVVPSLHVEYKKSKVKQYHKEGQALRTETTINDTYDFAIGRALRNLPALREIGFAANRRLLHVESLSHDCLIGEDRLARRHGPRRRRTINAPPGCASATAASTRSCTRSVSSPSPPPAFAIASCAITSPSSRGAIPTPTPAGSMTYDLRRLRLHGLIERVPHSHRYRITAGRRAGRHVLRAPLYPGPAPRLLAAARRGRARAQRAFDRLDAALAHFLRGGQTCRLKNLTQSLTLLGVKTPSGIRLQNSERRYPNAPFRHRVPGTRSYRQMVAPSSARLACGRHSSPRSRSCAGDFDSPQSSAELAIAE